MVQFGKSWQISLKSIVYIVYRYYNVSKTQFIEDMKSAIQHAPLAAAAKLSACQAIHDQRYYRDGDPTACV